MVSRWLLLSLILLLSAFAENVARADWEIPYNGGKMGWDSGPAIDGSLYAYPSLVYYGYGSSAYLQCGRGAASGYDYNFVFESVDLVDLSCQAPVRDNRDNILLPELFEYSPRFMRQFKRRQVSPVYV